MAPPSASYEPQAPAQRVLYQIVHDHFETFRAQQPVAIIQRFGAALNLNVHVHALVLDGVFARNRAGALNFHPASRLTTLDVAEVLATVEPRIKRLLGRRGLGDGDNDGSASDAWADDAPVLAGLAAASVQGTVALGPHRGARLRRLGDPPEEGEIAAQANPGPSAA